VHTTTCTQLINQGINQCILTTSINHSYIEVHTTTCTQLIIQCINQCIH
jgi:hypothetical protein